MAMTASAIKEEVDKCFEAGMNEYIAKPFVPEDLRDKIIKTVMQNNGATSETGKEVNAILIVDDNDFNQMVAQDTLKDLFPEAKIDVAGDGQQAIDMIQANNFDIVLMDINMPVMDGHEATQYIRTKLNAPLNSIPIMAMTASDSKTEIDNCKKSGMDDFITKPFDPAILKEKINNLVLK